MNDKDYAPLSPACVRALNDKLYEKRKTAALEIEKMVREFHLKGQGEQVARILKILGDDFATSMNPQPRKGGLIGLAACAIALGKDSAFYASSLVRPVLSCFFDPDCRVRYYACESLYNIVKVTRGSVLPHFNEIFDGLSKLTADPDQNVRSGSETLDRLMKDVVTESSAFDLMAFIPLLRERIYVTNSFARRFIVSWVTMLDATPDIDMLVFLPEILDGMFKILGDIQPEISKQCEVAFGEFLKGISNAPSGRVSFKAMVNIVLSHCVLQDTNKDLIQYTAMLWLKEFVQLAGQDMLKFASGIISAVLPCLAMGERQKSIREVAKDVNRMMMKLVSNEEKSETLTESTDVNHAESKGDSSEESTTKEEDNQSAIAELLDLSPVVKVLCKHLSSKQMETRIASLEWIYHLHIKTPSRIFLHVEELFPLLLMTLSDPADEVVLLDLEVLAEISSSTVTHRAAITTNEQAALPSPIQKAVFFQDGMNNYFTKFMISLLGMFRTDSQLLDNRGAFIIRQLCLLLQAEHIYRSLAEILLHEDDLKFASVMVQTLNTILLTSTELFELRIQLKEFRTTESHSLFSCLYRSWCHNPVATVSLCLLTQSYKHSCDLLQHFGDLEVTVDFLTEIDKLIQLLESPIFTFLRLQLLDLENNHYLVKSLYGLLMLIPQSEAFRTLRNRLECVPNTKFSTERSFRNQLDSSDKGVNFKELLIHFEEFQVKHKENRRKLRQQLVSRTLRY